MKKHLLALVAALAMLAAVAGPAAAIADHTDVGTFSGEATVAPGLKLPGTSPVAGTWALKTEVTGLVNGVAQLEASGKLSPVAGIGAACGMSHGHSGEGQLVGAARTYNLSNLGWIASAGGTLPTSGTYELEGGAPTDSGPMIALVQAQGGQACASEAGATTFQVVGVSALL